MPQKKYKPTKKQIKRALDDIHGKSLERQIEKDENKPRTEWGFPKDTESRMPKASPDIYTGPEERIYRSGKKKVLHRKRPKA